MTVGPEERQDGTLLIPSVSANQSDNGLYRCSFVVRVDGVNAAPLVISAATVLLTVGGKHHSYSMQSLSFSFKD